jgi:hypothetical protein
MERGHGRSGSGQTEATPTASETEKSQPKHQIGTKKRGLRNEMHATLEEGVGKATLGAVIERVAVLVDGGHDGRGSGRTTNRQRYDDG